MTTVTIEQAQQINPLIDSDGDSYKVRQALIALSFLLEEEPKMAADSQQGFGIAAILRACHGALEFMDKEINQK